MGSLQPPPLPGKLVCHEPRKPLCGVVDLLRQFLHAGLRFAKEGAALEVRQPRLAVAQRLAQRALHRASKLLKPTREGGGVGRDQFRRRARSGRAQIGDEIGDGEIDLMPHGAHNRNGRGENGPRHALVVELP